jgi:hypothetical protein
MTKIHENETKSTRNISAYSQSHKSSNLIEKTKITDSSIIPSNLEKSLIYICKNLETENENLVKNNEILKDEIKDNYEYKSSQDLIPHYRLAIIRSQNEKNYYYEKYKNEKRNSKKIQKQLDDAFSEIEKKERKNVRVH